MQNRNQNGGISVHAIAGTHVVLLGMNADEASKRGLLGFAIQRKDETEGEQYWLPGFRTFKETYPNPKPGSLVSTHEHPIQAFLWGDYTAKPNHKYVYTIVPVSGGPKNLTYGKEVAVENKTEDEDQGTHAIYFNRGVAGSQAYARKFGNREPSDVPNKEAYKWLSRGLEEAILTFIGQARGARFALRASVYEFSWMPVLEAFRDASNSGADVKIVYDCRKAEPQKTSTKCIRDAGLSKLVIKRKCNPSYISHNKFIILLRDGKPVEVWTGSTNFSEGGIFGQSNVGHLVRDPNVAAKYLTYWEHLAGGMEAKKLRVQNAQDTPNPPSPPPTGIMPLFSPRPNLEALQWYADRMRGNENEPQEKHASLGFTAAFGVNRLLADVLGEEGPTLRYLLLEKRGATFNSFSKVRNNMIALGAVLSPKAVGDQKFQRWLGESLTNLNKFVRYLHTKYLFIDPLGANPLVVSGSANFSDASTVNNDENMLVIQGNTSVAHTYLGEFMRLWDHFYFRNVAQSLSRNATVSSAYLSSDDSWTKKYYESGSVHEKVRLLFA